MILILFLFIPFFSAIPYPSSTSTRLGIRPRLKSFHFDPNIIEGQTVRVFCQLLDGSQPLSFQWLKNGQPLLSASSNKNDDRIEIQTFNDYSSLAIYNIDRKLHSGNFTCLVSNSFGSDQHSSILIVQGV